MPLRTRLAITFAALFTVALIGLEVATFFIVRQTLLNGIDSELRLGAELLQKDFSQSNKSFLAYFNGSTWVPLLTEPSVANLDRTNLFAQVYRMDGRPVAASANLPQALEVDEATLRQVLAGEPVARTMSAGKFNIRELITPLRLGPQVVGILQVARATAETDRALQVLGYALLGAGLVVTFAAARGGLWLTKAALRPIDQITATAQSIVRAEDLSLRVPVPDAQDELQRLTVTMNDLLARLEGLFSAQRRFLADVSHELRTPLAAMQGNLDVLNRGAARDPQLLAESLSDMHSEVNRLIRMVNDLLLLGQTEAGISLRRDPVELDTLLLEVHRELRSLAAAGQVQLRIGHEDQVIVLGDRDRLKQALLNLTVNAIQYTPAGGSVTLSLASAGAYGVLAVSDTGVGIDPESLPQIFERFYRADRSRTRGGGGAGLGLAIVKWIVDAHNGRVEVRSTPGSGSTFLLSLPLAAAAPTLPAEAEPALAGTVRGS